MNIRNYSFKVSTKKIKETINLLPNEYKNNNLPIYVFSNRLVYRIFAKLSCFFGINNFEEFDYLEYDNCGAYHKSDKNQNSLHIVVFFKNKKINFIANLFHELRHHYQTIYLRDVFVVGMNQYVNCTTNYEVYEKQPVEIDANRFAMNCLKIYRKDLCRMYNISYHRPSFANMKVAVKNYKEL